MLIAQAGEGDEIQAALLLLAQEFLGKLQTLEERVRRRLGIQIWAESLSNDRILALMRRGVDEPRKLLAEMIRSAELRGDLPLTLRGHTEKVDQAQDAVHFMYTMRVRQCSIEEARTIP